MRILKNAALALIIPLYLLACGTQSNSGSSAVVNIKHNEYRQEIDGFGGSNAWTRLPRDPDAAQELVKLLYSKTEGMGFTILRNRIPFRERLSGDNSPGNNDGFIERKSDNSYDFSVSADGTKTFNLNWNSWDISGTKDLIEKIKDLGGDGPEKLVIMSCPWTPPNNRVTQWKEDVTGVNTRLNYAMDWAVPDVWGRLKKDKYEDYADLLADYVKNFEARMGAPLDILSIQNEPNWKVAYESAYWSGTDMRDFLKVIERRFPKKGVVPGAGGVGIMFPEFENFNFDFNVLIKPSLDDPASESIITHIALHQYNGAYDSSPRAGAKAFPEIIAAGKRFWQTEVSGSGPNLPAGTGIENALYYARMIHFDMTLAEMNAFLYWWLWTNSGSDKNFPGSLIMVEDGDTVTAALRLYAMGQYSRFIRPGWFRIECDSSPASGIYSSAYRNPKTGEIAVVIINDKYSAASVSLNLSDAAFDGLELWRTSAHEKLKRIGKQKISRNTANVNLAPKSVNTFYGKVK
jgi:O-glycosyl hydrolase